jgi:hypothetical protein
MISIWARKSGDRNRHHASTGAAVIVSCAAFHGKLAIDYSLMLPGAPEFIVTSIAV